MGPPSRPIPLGASRVTFSDPTSAEGAEARGAIPSGTGRELGTAELRPRATVAVLWEVPQGNGLSCPRGIHRRVSGLRREQSSAFRPERPNLSAGRQPSPAGGNPFLSFPIFALASQEPPSGNPEQESFPTALGSRRSPSCSKGARYRREGERSPETAEEGKETGQTGSERGTDRVEQNPRLSLSGTGGPRRDDALGLDGLVQAPASSALYLRIGRLEAWQGQPCPVPRL